jgi:peptidoglycan/LPS O-acetylase OafA/YrhL
MTQPNPHDTIDQPNRAPHMTRVASSTGLAVAGLGVVVLNVSPFLNWVNPQGEANPRTGYETDSLVPFMAYLGIGLLLAMLYAAQRARRRQHRGLTLASMAIGIAAAIQCTAFAINPMGGLERGDDLSPQIGVFVGIIGAALWALGSGLLAKEIEGDDHEHDHGHERDHAGARDR